jgi:hypothetical protein
VTAEPAPTRNEDDVDPEEPAPTDRAAAPTDQTAVPCNAAQLHRFGDLQTAHGPHEWIVQPGMDSVRCPGAGEQPAVPAVQAPATDRAALRDRIADVLADADGWKWAPGFKTQSPTWHGYQTRADAVLAVLPATTDRAAVAAVRALHQPMSRAGFLICAHCSGWNGVRCLGVVADYPCSTIAVLDAAEQPATGARKAAQVSENVGILRVADELRRMAAEAPQPETCSNCRDSGLDPRYSSGDFDCPDCPAAPAQPGNDTEAAFTEAGAAFMQIGVTPALKGLRTELRIEGHPPLIGWYVGATMQRLSDMPRYERFLAIEPRLLFEYADPEDTP